MADVKLDRDLTNEEHEMLDSLGEPLVDWDVDEYPRHDRGRLWYILAAIAGVALIIYAIATANFLFAVIILMIGVITLVTTLKQPDRVHVVVTTTGVIVDDSYYDWRSIKDFSIIYEPPHVKLLYIDFQSVMQPRLSIPLEDVDPIALRETLLPYCSENLERTEEGLTDLVRRLYKI